MATMDWFEGVFFGFMATLVLTGSMVVAQLAGWTRMDLPLILGTMLVGSVDLARVVGVVMHMVIGVGFALLYLIGFELVGGSGPLLGAAFGLVHGLAALTLIVPFLPAIHPRMASERSGPEIATELEPPGLLALNFGIRTPLVTIAAHVLYGSVLGVLLGAD